MNVIYSSEHFWILAYPAELGVELFDRDTRRTLYLQGPLARHFRQAMADIPLDAQTEENIDAFIDDYCCGATRPIVFH